MGLNTFFPLAQHLGLEISYWVNGTLWCHSVSLPFNRSNTLPVYNLHFSSTWLTTQEINRGYKTCTNLNLERVKHLFYPLEIKQLTFRIGTYRKPFILNRKSIKWLSPETGVVYDIDNSNKAPHFCCDECCHYQPTTFNFWCVTSGSRDG